MPTGIEAIVKQTEERKAEYESFRNDVPVLFVKARTTAKLRFLTDGQEIRDDYYHFIDKLSKNNKPYNEIRFCSRDEEGECKNCDEFGTETKRMFSAWVYVYHIDHPKQNQAAKDNPDFLWPQTENDEGEKVFRETLEKVMLFRSKHGKDDVWFQPIKTFFRKNRTLCDRDYEWHRDGETLDTQYSLVPLDKEPMNQKLQEILLQLPSLLDAVSGRLKKMPEFKWATAEKKKKDTELKKKEQIKELTKEETEEDEELF